MKLCYGALAILLVCLYIPAGSPALSKAALESSKNMMKQVCKNKSGVKQEWLNMAAKGDFPNERKFKCYVACVLNMAQALKGNKLQVEAARKQAEVLLPADMKDTALQQLDACKDLKGDDPCDLAYDFAICCWKTVPINHLIPT